MTTNEKRIKIAEACETLLWSECNPPGVCLGNGVPNYFNDLNAMHEAEKVLTIDQQITFQDSLIAFHNFGQGTPVGFAFRITHSTAAQRAEAFGKTLNLW